jgi:hypothetical protein
MKIIKAVWASQWIIFTSIILADIFNGKFMFGTYWWFQRNNWLCSLHTVYLKIFTN